VTLLYRHDAIFIGAILPYGRQRFEREEELDWRGYSEKIRKMLAENLEVRGLLTICKLRSLSDPAFWMDFSAKDEDEITEAAVRKGAELRRETRERAAENPARYQRFSDRVKALLAQFDAGLLAAKALLEGLEAVTQGLVEEGRAHLRTGLSPRAHGLLRLVEVFGGDQALTERIDALYASDASAPPYWQDREGLRRELRQQVRRLALEVGLTRVSELAAAVDEHAVKGYGKP
jgi:type I restriction enzyme R subunit